MQVQILIGLDPIVNLNFKLETQNSKTSNQSIKLIKSKKVQG